MSERTYKIVTACKINSTVLNVGETIIMTDEFKSTNSKNKNYYPQDLIQMLVARNLIKEAEK